MKWVNLVTREIVEEKETTFCIPYHSYKQMLEFEPTCKDIEELERVMNQ